MTPTALLANKAYAQDSLEVAVPQADWQQLSEEEKRRITEIITSTNARFGRAAEVEIVPTETAERAAIQDPQRFIDDALCRIACDAAAAAAAAACSAGTSGVALATCLAAAAAVREECRRRC